MTIGADCVLNDIDHGLYRFYNLLQEHSVEDVCQIAYNEAPKFDVVRINDVKHLELVKIFYTSTIRCKRKLKLKKVTRKMKKFKKFVTDKATITNLDYLDVLNKYRDNKDCFIFLDPPYFDRAKILIDILSLLQSAKCKVMLIINSNSITKTLYNEFIAGTYYKIYSSNVIFEGKACGNASEHLIVTNY